VSGISLTVPLVLGPRVVRAGGADVKVFGPGKVPITLTVNGKVFKANLRPSITGAFTTVGVILNGLSQHVRIGRGSIKTRS